jgi:hypothetical protein
VEIGGDTKAVILAAGLIFLWALLLGAWKYREMSAAEDGLAHPYVDIAHRAALLYSFATLLLATFVELSGFSAAVNLLAAFVPIFFFATAIAVYMLHGIRRDTDNQLRDPVRGTGPYMVALIVGEVGGTLVLLAGFVEGQL